MLTKRKTLREQLTEWNSKYPFDLAWRIKNEVQFGSQEHKSMDFVSMLFNFIQDKEIEDYLNKDKKDSEQLEHEFMGTSDKEVVTMDKEEIADEFDNLDFSQFNDPISDANTERDNIQG